MPKILARIPSLPLASSLQEKVGGFKNNHKIRVVQSQYVW